jgi:peptidoglycan/LPS O-acetylase OafA/YrhL
VRSHGQTNFVTGLRGAAVLGVILIHTGGGGLRDLGLVANRFVDLGASGVYAFFVISGFSIASAWQRHPNYPQYILMRFFRLAPLYYLTLWASMSLGLTATYWQNFFGLNSIDGRNILLHLSFLSWTDYTITNSIIGVEWSLSIEFFWYLFLPVIVGLVSQRYGRQFVFWGTAVLYFISRLDLSYLFGMESSQYGLAMAWSPLPYAASYVLGVWVFQLRIHWRHTPLQGDLAILGSGLTVLIHLLEPRIASLVLGTTLLVSLITASLLLFCSSRSLATKLVFENPPILWMGVLSYGLYLVHFPIITYLSIASEEIEINQLGTLLVTLTAATAIAFLAHLLVERPGIAFGRLAAKFIASSK